LLYDTNIVISDLVFCARDGRFLCLYLTEEQSCTSHGIYGGGNGYGSGYVMRQEAVVRGRWEGYGSGRCSPSNLRLIIGRQMV
jgi:hypothetical protein